MSVESTQSVEVSLECTEVITKYQTAATIANKALTAVICGCKEAADIYELCKLGDDTIMTETGKVYNKKKKVSSEEKEDEKKGKGDEKMAKGIGFPTCISVNEVAGHFSPLKGESKALRAGDLVKVDLAVMIDGFLAQVAHTIVVPDETKQIQDRRADVILAAYNAAECALRLVQPGKKNSEITTMLESVSSEFKCTPVAGVLSHEIKRNCIDGDKVIIGKENINEEQRVDEFEFELNKAYTLDIMISTGDGKVREQECRHTVYKRAPEVQYMLKTQKARQFLSEVNKNFPNFPFSLRNIEDEQCARIGIGEAKRHKLLTDYPVLAERPGEYIAQFKFTVLLLPGGTKKITGLPLVGAPGLPAELPEIDSSYKIESEETKKLLAQSAAPRKKRNKNKKDDKKDE